MIPRSPLGLRPHPSPRHLPLSRTQKVILVYIMDSSRSLFGLLHVSSRDMLYHTKEIQLSGMDSGSVVRARGRGDQPDPKPVTFKALAKCLLHLVLPKAHLGLNPQITPHRRCQQPAKMQDHVVGCSAPMGAGGLGRTRGFDLSHGWPHSPQLKCHRGNWVSLSPDPGGWNVVPVLYKGKPRSQAMPV